MGTTRKLLDSALRNTVIRWHFPWVGSLLQIRNKDQPPTNFSVSSLDFALARYCRRGCRSVAILTLSAATQMVTYRMGET
jgi:hypothetical protein